MRAVVVLVLAVGLIAAGCGDDAGPATTAPNTTVRPTTTERATTTTATFPDIPGRGAAGIGDSYFPLLGNGGYEVQHYTIELDVDPSTGSLDGSTTIEAAATETMSSFHLDFTGPDISTVTVDGVSAEHTRDSGELIVAPAAPIAAGEEFAVTVAYAGIPDLVLSEAAPFPIGWRTGPDGIFTVGEPDGSNAWFPGNHHPRDKATYTFEVTVPEGMTAVANGLLVARMETEAGTRFRWEASDPMASYLAVLVVAELDEVAAPGPGGIPLRSYLPRTLAIRPPPALGMLPDMIEFFADRFGPYPFEAFGIVVVDGFETALETQTMSIFGSFVAQPGFIETVLVHELAHQWMGNSVSPADWSDIWLNEGFATFAEWLWYERSAGAEGYAAQIAGSHAFARTAPLAAPGDPGVAGMFGEPVYVRGALTLHALREEVGDDMLFAILREYHQRFAGGAATTEDFVTVAESVSGRELGELFEAWLYRDQVPPLP